VTQARPRASVLLPQGHLGVLDYALPDGVRVAPGDFVRAPLGPRPWVGVVWESGDSADIPDAKLRPLFGKIDVPPLALPLRRFIAWVADYYVQPPGQVLRMAMSVSDAFETGAPRPHFRASDQVSRGLLPSSLTPKRAAALAALGPEPGTLAELAQRAKVSPGVIAGLREAGALVACPPPSLLPPPEPDPNFAQPMLSPSQAAAADRLTQANGFAPLLLDGVTGAGKTEVYFEAIAAALRRGEQTLVLLPEIALTRQWLARFAARFGVAPVEWHSDLGAGARKRNWLSIARGTAKVVVGARSALFLPYAQLGLIIVDEEHEGSFKQEDGVPYHARDMAVVRASLEACPVILSSATPSLDSLFNVRRGRYAHVPLPSRFGGAALPDVRAIDMRRAAPARGRWLSPPLLERVSAALDRGEQALLFLNRRGYAPLTLCRSCGERVSCPQCTAWLVEHKLTGRLQCHHCGFAAPIPRLCQACGAEDTLVACGPGVERVAEEAQALLPEARLAVVTSDTMNTPARAATMLAAVEAKEVNLLVGTQLVTKGYHFPDLTVVGVVDADLGLSGGDLRAGERTFQQITQVAGRAGRAAKPGEVWLQTYQPDAPIMRALVTGDAAAFLAAETDARERAAMPPYGRLAALIIAGAEHARVEETARALGRTAPTGVQVFGPAPAPLALLRGRHRMRLLLKADRRTAVQPLLRAWLASVKVPHGVSVSVDVDPYSFL
jgi:primosomal protein N' (replication factor Y) (superfamily II helicase)